MRYALGCVRGFYGLLAGIDQYPNPANRLYGCINDVDEMESYLRYLFVGEEPSRILVLKDQKATRGAVVDGFRQHLARAQPGDTALFYYAGHGSQEEAPEEFWAIEPDHKNETLVCWDSRTEGGWDLADKELAALIRELSAQEIRVVVILDCCHSGSGSRAVFVDAAERRIPLDPRKRPLSAYLPVALDASGLLGARAPSGWQVPKASRHILLAACRDEQTAKEYSPEGRRHGALTYFLLQTLKSATIGLSYQELFRRVSTLVSANVTAQNPQLEATEEEDLAGTFLSGEPKPRVASLMVSYREGTWYVDAGTVHGIPAPRGGESVALAIFPLNTPDSDLHDLSRATVRATVDSVSSTSAAIRPLDQSKLDIRALYKAVITALPLPRMPVSLEGDPAGQQSIRTALSPSLYVSEGTGEANLRVICQGGQFAIARAGTNRPLVAQLVANSANSAAVVSSLEAIAKWTSLVNLQNPLSRIAPGEIRLSILKNKDTGEEFPGGELRMEYTQPEEGRFQNPFFWVRVQNMGSRPLYCALLELTELFGIRTELRPEGTIKLNPGDSMWGLDGNKVYAKISKELQAIGVTESRDVIKMIACTSRFDARLLTQPELEGPRAEFAPTPINVSGTLNRLMSRLQSRSLGGEPDEPDQIIDDFFTATVGITTVKPRGARNISAEQPIDLGSAVTIEPHSAFRATARLTTEPSVQRDLGNCIRPAIFRGDEEPGAPEPFYFSNSRGSDPGLSVLELSAADSRPLDIGSVTADNPLRIRLEMPVEADVEVLPFAFDGDFFLPLGRVTRREGGLTAELERLPQPLALMERSISGSIRILFQKLIAKPLGRPYAYPILAVAALGPDGRVSYNSELKEVKNRVASAERILLAVHGIVGDTRAIAASLLAAGSSDLVLTFDYENLNTTIEQNAALLKERLTDVGLGDGHGKSLRVVAHSMGGLVARWFIEVLGGNQAVQSLVCLGTPHDGSPWPTVEGIVSATASLALNGLFAFAVPATALGFLIRQTRKLNKALPELAADSAVVALLARTADPKIPYLLFTGNTSQFHKPPLLPTDTWRKRLAESFSISDLMHRVLSVGFFNQPNDIAVSVVSGGKVSLNRKPAPAIHVLPCDHITYFSNPESVTLLWQTLGLTPPKQL